MKKVTAHFKGNQMIIRQADTGYLMYELPYATSEQKTSAHKMLQNFLIKAA